MVKKLYILLFFLSNSIYATGGYDNGSPVGEGKLQLDFTLNPGDVIDYGQSYITWNYGLTDTLAFHGYGSHEASPFKLSFLQPYVESTKLALGAFRNASGRTYPTYSIDVKF